MINKKRIRNGVKDSIIYYLGEALDDDMEPLFKDVMEECESEKDKEHLCNAIIDLRRLIEVYFK